MKSNPLLAAALVAALAFGAFSCKSESGEPAANPPEAAPAKAPEQPAVFFAVKTGSEVSVSHSPDQDAPVASTLYPGACLKVSGASDDGQSQSVETLDGEAGLWVAAAAIEESETCGPLFALRDDLYKTMKPEWDAFAARFEDNPNTLIVPQAFTAWLEKRMPDPVTEDILCWDPNDEYIDGPSGDMSRDEAVDMLAQYLESASPYIDPEKPAPTPAQMFFQTAMLEPGVTGGAATVTFLTQGGDCIPSMALRRRDGAWQITGLKRTCMTYCTVFGDY